MQRIGNPVPVFLDARGNLLDGGYIYVGAANADPEVTPITVYSDPALTVPLAQPIRTVGGFAVNGVIPVFMFIAQDDFSQRTRDSNGAQVVYSPSVYTDTSSFQAASPILDALVANGTPTAYGLTFLKLANYAAFKAANSIPDFLQLTGGTMTGETTHQGSGVETYWSDATMTSGKLFFTDSTGTDPTTAPGQIWFKGVV